MNHQQVNCLFLGLNSKQLNNVLSHIKAGEEHLSKTLSDKGYQELMKQSSLTQEQKKDIPENINVKSGKVALLANTIITSTLGAWMGFYDYLNIESKNTYEFMGIVVVAVFIGCIIGYISFHTSNEENKKSIHRQKLNNLKIYIAELLLSQRIAVTKNSIDEVNAILKSIYSHHDWSHKEKKYINLKSRFEKLINIKKNIFNLYNNIDAVKGFLHQLDVYRIHSKIKISSKLVPGYLKILMHSPPKK